MHREGNAKSKPKKPNSFEELLLYNQAGLHSLVSKNLGKRQEKGRAVKCKIKDMSVRRTKNHLACAAAAASATRPFPCSK